MYRPFIVDVVNNIILKLIKSSIIFLSDTLWYVFHNDGKIKSKLSNGGAVCKES
jgi:hypothetical protein